MRKLIINKIPIEINYFPQNKYGTSKPSRILSTALCILFILSFNFIGQAQQFTVYNSWDFESETLGTYDSTYLVQDFNISLDENGDLLLEHDDQADIVMDTINGTATKVFRVTHDANTLYAGFEMNVDLETDYDELYLSYNVKFSNEFNSTAGGKLPGLGGLPNFGTYCPTGSMGFRAHNIYKRAGEIYSYHYDRTTGYCPWAISGYDYDSIYFNNGSWYNITQRLVMNTFSGSTANADGIKELWVDGRLIYQKDDMKYMEINNDTLKIDAFRLANFYGGDGISYTPLTECYTYFDNFKVYIPGNDSISGDELHHPTTILPTPNEITDKDVYYDQLINSERTLTNDDYGSDYGYCIDEAYLIDAGEGNTVEFNITTGEIAGGDFLFFYDGNTTDARIIDIVSGFDDSFTGLRESTGRYMFVRFSTDRENVTTGWSGTISFDGDTLAPASPTSLAVTDSTSSSISIGWTDNSSNESKFIIERSFQSGTGYAVIDSVNANTTSYTNTGLTIDTVYYYRVKARNSNGDSGYSNTVSARLGDNITSDTIAKINFYYTGFTQSGWTNLTGDSGDYPASLGNGISLSMSGTLDEGENGEPTTILPTNVSSSYCYIDYNNETPVVFTVSGLDTARAYTFDFFISRDDATASGDRTTFFSIGTDTVSLNPIGNTDSLLTISEVSPNSSGNISITMKKLTGTYGYINALIIRENSFGPSAPTNLVVTDSTSNSISIAWTDNSDDEDKFIIERSISSGSGFAVIDSVNANTTSYTNTGLTAETTYYYQVKAKNSSGSSGYSNELSVTTLPESVVDTTWVSTIKVNFAPSGYSGGSEWNDFLSYTSTSSLSLDDSLGYSTGYTLYNEDSWDGSGSGGETTGPYPQNVNQTYWYKNVSECDLELRNLDNDNLYSIEVYGSRDTETTREIRVTIGSSYDIITVNNNTSDKAIFSYVSPSSGVIRMEITIETDEYSYLNAIVVREYEISSIPVPEAPSNLHATDSTTTTISLVWTDNADNEDKFIIERSLSSGSGFAVIDSVNANTTSYSDTELTAETTYYYQVKAKNSYGSSGYSNELSVTTLPEPVADTTWVNTIKVNFAPSGYSGGSEWNDFLSYTSTSSLSLDDSLGNSTGYTLYNEDSWDASANGGETTGPYPQNVNQTYWYKNVSECDLELRNLDNDNLYSIEVYGSRDTETTREVRVTIGSSYDIITVNNNTSDKAIFPYISPSSGVIRMEITIETDEYSYLNAIVVREYEVTNSTPIDTIAKINFYYSGFSESGWVNLTGDSGDYPADLGNGIYLSKSGTLDEGEHGEPSTILPSNVSSSYCFIEYNNETPVVFTVSGLDTVNAYTFDFFTSRDDASASGDRTTYFSIGADTVSLNPIGNTDSLLTISNVSPNSSGNVSITMKKLTGQYGYINAMYIMDIGEAEKSAFLSKDGNELEEKLDGTEIKVYPNPGSTMITISGFEQAVEIKMVDMLGKVVYLEGKVNNSTQIDVSNLKKGLYLILVKKENNIHVTKFIKN